MSYFKHHVFFCTNQRAPGEQCCNNHGAQAMRDHPSPALTPCPWFSQGGFPS